MQRASGEWEVKQSIKHTPGSFRLPTSKLVRGEKVQRSTLAIRPEGSEVIRKGHSR